MEEWPQFTQHAANTWHGMPAGTMTLQWTARGVPNNASLEREHLGSGDEAGVQGCFQAAVGHVISAVCRGLGRDARFGDWRAANLRIPGDRGHPLTPDVAVIDLAGNVMVIGEVKTPWPDEQNLGNAVGDESDDWFRHILGQVAQYLYRAQRRYAFLPTYDQTAFVSANNPVLQYSLGVEHNDAAWEEGVTLLQAVYHLIGLAKTGHEFRFEVLKSAWVRDVAGGTF